MNQSTLDYLKNDQIGKVIAKGLASVYTEQSKTPIKYLAHWLKSYSKNQQQLNKLQIQAKIVKVKLIEDRNREDQIKKQQQSQKLKSDISKARAQQFLTHIAKHQYQQQLLYKDFPEHLQNILGLTAVYIGQLNHPSKYVTDQDTEENAHLDLTKPKLINYIGSSVITNCSIVGQTLSLDKGVTARAFQLNIEDQPPQIGEDGQPIPQQKKQNYVYIPNVVKNQAVHYFRLPKLGAYIAIPLIHNSYLTESIFDKALEHKKKQNNEIAEFQKSKNEALAQIQKLREQLHTKINELKQKNAQEHLFEPLNQELKGLDEQTKQKQAQIFEVQNEQLPTQKRQYVVCADTLGLDREITQAQRNSLVKFVLHFKKSWEDKEKQLLFKDVQTQILYENQYTTQSSIEDLVLAIDQALQLDQQTKQKMQAIEDQTLRNYKIQGWKIDKLKAFIQTNEKFSKSFGVLINFRIIKFKELIQNILYLNGKTKQQINIPNRASLNWKQVRKDLISSYNVFQLTLNYVIQGAKPNNYAAYAKINSIIERIQFYNETQIFNYNIGLGILRKYMLLVLKQRIKNIELRKVQRENERTKRQEMIIQNERTTEEKIKALQNHKAVLPAEEVQSFSQEQWSAKYDQQHPLLQIPPEVVQDIDNDL